MFLCYLGGSLTHGLTLCQRLSTCTIKRRRCLNGHVAVCCGQLLSMSLLPLVASCTGRRKTG